MASQLAFPYSRSLSKRRERRERRERGERREERGERREERGENPYLCHCDYSPPLQIVLSHFHFHSPSGSNRNCALLCGPFFDGLPVIRFSCNPTWYGYQGSEAQSSRHFHSASLSFKHRQREASPGWKVRMHSSKVLTNPRIRQKSRACHFFAEEVRNSWKSLGRI